MRLSHNAEVNRGAFVFFLHHAGYSTPPGRAACALAYARAEDRLRDEVENQTMRVQWVDDEVADLSWMDDYSDHDRRAAMRAVDRYGVLGCVIERRCDGCDGWEHVTSLWGIIGDADYHRVIEAQLACEIFDV